MTLASIPHGLKDLRELEKILISKRIIFKNIAIQHGESEIANINLQKFKRNN